MARATCLNFLTLSISRIRDENCLEFAPTIGGLLTCPLWSAIRLASTTPTRIGWLQSPRFNPACIGAREIGSERTALRIVVLDHEGTRHRRAYPGPALPQWDADLGDTSPWVRSTERPNANPLAPNREPIASGDPALRFYPDDANKIVMVAFDLLYLNGYDWRKLPRVERVGTRAQRGRTIKPDGSCALADDYSACIEPF